MTHLQEQNHMRKVYEGYVTLTCMQGLTSCNALTPR